MILVDSSVWIDYFRGTPTPQVEMLDALLGVEPIAIGDLNLTEVLQGFTTERDFIVAKELLASLDLISLCVPEIAVQAAVNYRTLRARGITVRKTIHTIIATRCIADDLPLLYSDRYFDPFVTHLGLRPALPAA